MPGIDDVDNWNELQSDMQISPAVAVSGRQGRKAQDQADGVTDRHDMQNAADQKGRPADFPRAARMPGNDQQCCCHCKRRAEERKHGDVQFHHRQGPARRQRPAFSHIIYVQQDAADGRNNAGDDRRRNIAGILDSGVQIQRPQKDQERKNTQHH